MQDLTDVEYKHFEELCYKLHINKLIAIGDKYDVFDLLSCADDVRKAQAAGMSAKDETDIRKILVDFSYEDYALVRPVYTALKRAAKHSDKQTKKPLEVSYAPLSDQQIEAAMRMENKQVQYVPKKILCEICKYDIKHPEPPFELVHVGECTITEEDDSEREDGGMGRYEALHKEAAKQGYRFKFYTLGELGSKYRYRIVVGLSPEDWPHCSIGDIGCYCNKGD